MVNPGETILSADIGALAMNFSMEHMQAPPNMVYSDSFARMGGNAGTFFLDQPTYGLQTRAIASDWADADSISAAVLFGAYLYLLLNDNGTGTSRLYRYDKTNLAAGGTLMTTSGQAFATTANFGMSCDPSGNFYFTSQAGNSASTHIISKYTVSGTVLTFVSNTTCGATTTNFYSLVMVDSSGNMYGLSNVDHALRKYNSSGTLQWTSGSYTTVTFSYVMDTNKIFLGRSLTDAYGYNQAFYQ